MKLWLSGDGSEGDDESGSGNDYDQSGSGFDEDFFTSNEVTSGKPTDTESESAGLGHRTIDTPHHRLVCLLTVVTLLWLR